ncbi:lasso peptide biosynthesis B2 protein [Streptomyces sp. MST-110588]|uniref:lasso peptide biosynthesis B2 protein n=1 Tax=Streptomyces sp. MST-110588 TaxID=2833628 RepID=UPI001F5C0EA6|nr:lasso peptide biosynthesis B2 protein [Streptomyces sp. MST-110588]UNO43087.1 lasso peptide biosynthesis B2 protein [Streptomyces sp. MST-110588]
MTVPVVSELPVRLSRRRQITARCAVAAARALILLPPHRLGQVLRALRHGARPARADRTLSARQAVVSVSARCAGQGCLQRSVATALLCRLRGTWPDWCTGVRTRPFRAHAWVEAQGAAVGESEDMALYHVTMSVRHPRTGPRQPRTGTSQPRTDPSQPRQEHRP